MGSSSQILEFKRQEKSAFNKRSPVAEERQSLSMQKAAQQYEAADHLLHATLPLVKDPKLLMGIVHNLAQAYEYAIDAVLAYERQLLLVPPYPNHAKTKFDLFRNKTMRRNKIPPSYANLLLDLDELIELQKKCPVEFQRGNRYVLCSQNYLLKIVSIKEIGRYLQQTKEFLDIISKIIRMSKTNIQK